MPIPTLKPLLAGVALLASLAAQANLVTNGGFEIGQGDGWTVSGNTSFTVFDGFAPQAGALAAGIGAPPDEPGVLSQTLATQAGSLYRLSFWLQNSADAAPGQANFFSMNWDGGSAEMVLSDASAFEYTQFSYELTASAAATDLRFSFANFAGFWDFDSVSVSGNNTVPEPAGAALLAAALIAAAWARRRARH